MPPIEQIWLFALAIVAGGVAGVVGFGIGSLLTPAVGLLVGTKLAVAMVALPHVAGTAMRLWVLRAEIDRRVLATFGVASAVGGLIGGIAHALVTSPFLSVVLGALLVGAGLLELSGMGRQIRFDGASATIAGMLSGLFGGLVGNQGGIRSAALLRFDLQPRALVATATATALLVDAARVPVYALTSAPEIVEQWPTLLVLTVGVLLGTVIGTPILRRVPERAFRTVLAAILVLVGVVLVATAGADVSAG